MKVCVGCQKEFKPSSRHRLCPKCKAIKRKKTCIICEKPIWAESIKCLGCSNKSKTKLGKPDGYKYNNHNGYVYVKKKDHPRGKNHAGYVFEHILVMEEKLGRFLFPGENVHHINGVRDDNRPENLELWIKPQPVGIRAKDAVKWAKEILGRYDNNTITGY